VATTSQRPHPDNPSSSCLISLSVHLHPNDGVNDIYLAALL
jgi:hypothetical protein